MPPKITNSTSWQQAEILMQPAFIRVIDNLRKQLDISDWKGTYQDVLTWPANTTDETKALVTQLVQEMETATPIQVEEIRKTLASLPMPHPGYNLLLQRHGEQVNIDLWDLCYQVCFLNYSPENTAVDIDTSLIDEYGDVDWQYLENKTQILVEQVFASLPILGD
ncbi:hypothetical protein VB638_15260 [Dolichospermum sp. UHCC 0684]|jgi:hypothetical protein|uniref:hypothetical protein n=1 Tax=Nostocales TaxID=1161 RepID=UPI00029B6319|nr:MULTISPECIES: hypothetical protein [Nostocales]MBO1053550.1 hypothetical protein [Dolichospermum sp. DET73]AFW93651.1 hypothetical protein ANA_C10859 [Anabaena sp. 90]MEA5530911.1 hypothetical protein [Dolichospermum sp. UHCC 0684]MTJ16154.1 hypothetical protein [Dolichospermum sp. UHCC 0299]MTJ22562.1 hypothetical protein [Dolichospermum sp. UHCC 0352]